MAGNGWDLSAVEGLKKRGNRYDASPGDFDDVVFDVREDK